MQPLECLNLDFTTLQRGNPFGSSARGSERCDGWNATLHGSPANRFFVEVRIGPVGRVDDQVNPVAFDEINRVRTAFLHLEHALDAHPGRFDQVRRSVRRNQLEPHVYETARHVRNIRLVLLVHAYEHRSLRRQFLTG